MLAYQHYIPSLHICKGQKADIYAGVSIHFDQIECLVRNVITSELSTSSVLFLAFIVINIPCDYLHEH